MGDLGRVIPLLFKDCGRAGRESADTGWHYVDSPQLPRPEVGALPLKQETLALIIPWGIYRCQQRNVQWQSRTTSTFLLGYLIPFVQKTDGLGKGGRGKPGQLKPRVSSMTGRYQKWRPNKLEITWVRSNVGTHNIWTWRDPSYSPINLAGLLIQSWCQSLAL